jgi:hypothetical protein
MAGWFKIASSIATLLLLAAGGYYVVWGPSALYRAGGAVLALFGVAGFLDTLISRIELDEQEIRLISLVRTRCYPRADFESAKVDGGAVVLKRSDGGSLVLPDTGKNSMSLRNTVHAWVRRGQGQP